MPGIDRNSGTVLDGWPHVVQSIGVIFTTARGTRVMRRYFGSAVPRLLGELLVPSTIVRFYAAIASALDLWEPRFRLVRIVLLTTSPEELRAGRLSLSIQGEYRPRGHLGDFASAGLRQVTLSSLDGNIRVLPE